MNTSILLAFDGLLLIAILSLAWAALASRDARRSIILFMAFGLILALAWGRLLAPDVALAEAAIGAGLSGALLLAAVGRQQGGRSTSGRDPQPAEAPPAVRWAVTLLCAGLSGILGWALLAGFASSARDTTAQAVAANLATSGVSNPVTAVLLNFRAYDTLLELAVLLTAVDWPCTIDRVRKTFSSDRSVQSRCSVRGDRAPRVWSSRHHRFSADRRTLARPRRKRRTSSLPVSSNSLTCQRV